MERDERKKKTRTGHKATEGNKVWQRRGDRHLCDDWSETNSSSVPSCVRGHPSSDSFLPRTTPLGTGTGSRFCVAPCTCMPNKEPVVRTQDHADTTSTTTARTSHRHSGSPGTAPARWVHPCLRLLRAKAAPQLLLLALGENQASAMHAPAGIVR